jgi:hypothetical protein
LFAVDFENKEEKEKIFEGELYFLNTVGLFMRYWNVGFDSQPEDFSKTPV